MYGFLIPDKVLFLFYLLTREPNQWIFYHQENLSMCTFPFYSYSKTSSQHINVSLSLPTKDGAFIFIYLFSVGKLPTCSVPYAINSNCHGKKIFTQM